MAMKRKRVTAELAKLATRYVKMKKLIEVRRRGLSGFNTAEEACLEWIAIELAIGCGELFLVFTPKLNLTVYTWRLDGDAVRANIDLTGQKANHKFKVHVWAIKKQKRNQIWFDLNMWGPPTAYNRSGRVWKWRSEAWVMVEHKPPGPLGFETTSYGIKVSRTNGKAGAG